MPLSLSPVFFFSSPLSHSRGRRFPRAPLWCFKCPQAFVPRRRRCGVFAGRVAAVEPLQKGGGQLRPPYPRPPLSSFSFPAPSAPGGAAGRQDLSQVTWRRGTAPSTSSAGASFTPRPQRLARPPEPAGGTRRRRAATRSGLRRVASACAWQAPHRRHLFNAREPYGCSALERGSTRRVISFSPRPYV